jgi:nicotinate-nucleotide pyrophosphorylase (carboxylating)
VRSILQAERPVLNLMQRMSGISTNTRKIVDSIAHTNCKVLDTRKTTPGLRWFEKEAVRIGGGSNHRFGLYDMIMLKDNHIDYAGSIESAIERVKEYLKTEGRELAIEVEARDLEEVRRIVDCGGVDRIMFDNFSPDEIREALKLIPDGMETEASGGINSETIVAYAETGVDFASMGALTHSVKSLDLSLKAIEN